MTRPWTSFGAGTSAAAAFERAGAGSNPPPVSADTPLLECAVPPGVDAAKLGTWAQKLAIDPAAEVPEDARAAASDVAAVLGTDVVIALAMGPSPVADKMLARLGIGEPGERAYLLLGLRSD